MKKLFTMLWILLSLCIGISAAFAEEIPVTITPEQQYAIMWSVLNFHISTSGAVTQNSKIQITLPSNLKYLSASISPRNLLQIPLGEQPYWLINAGDNFSVDLTVKEINQWFSESNLLVQLINWDEWSANWIVSPIADIQVEKVITSPNPKNTWDTVSFDIVIKNIGSSATESVKVVDIWPSNVLNFVNYWVLNWTQVVPYIYNWISNQYEFTIWNMEPGEESVLSVSGTMNAQKPIGTEFANTAFAVVGWEQYSTWNDKATVTWFVSWYPNLFVTVQKLSQDPTMNGDAMRYSVTFGNSWQEILNTWKLVVYLPEIMNQNNISVSLLWMTQEWNRLSRDLNRLQAWYQDTITISWAMMTSSPVGTQYTFRALVSTDQEELTWIDNESILTWKIQSLFVWELSAGVQNLTRPNMNVNNTKIKAISWDEVKISITLVNNGNITQTWLLRVVYGTEIWYFQENVSLVPWKSTVFNVNKIVWPKGFQSMTPEIKFTYWDGLNITKSIEIEEPLQCGDWFITQNEACDKASTEWLLPGQQCSDNCMSIITTDITNRACIQYTSERWNWEVCDDEIIYIWDQDYACKSIMSSWNIVQTDNDWKWSMRFTCTTSNWLIADSIKIDCGTGWQVGIGHNKSSFSYTCNYKYDEDWDNGYTASCIVNGEQPTNPSCEKDVMVWYGFYGNCGNGIIEPGEDCDLWNTTSQIWRPKLIWDFLDFSGEVATPHDMINNDYYCKNCKIIHDWDFVYEPVGCMQTDTPISVMDNEILPFWWRVWIKDTQRVVSEDECYWYTQNKTLLLEDSMLCHFAVYNGKSYSQMNSQPASRFVTECFNDNFKRPIYDYFSGTHKTTANWSSIATINALLDTQNHIDEYWEYKLVLEEVEYRYCTKDTHAWKTGQRYGAVCEVDFAVTRPYTMQISTLWVNPIATSDEFLHDFWDMNWHRLLNKTDLDSVINTDDSSYTVTTNAQEKIKEFKEKYEKLAVEVKSSFYVNGKTIGEMFGSNVTVMKVPNQHIYFIKWKNGNNHTLKLSQENLLGNKKWITSAYTIFVDGLDVEIEWNITQYAMIITTKTMKFKDKWEDTNARCVTWWQVLQWLFVALDGFVAWDPLKNTSKDKQWCAWWWLHVKWVLVWDGLEDVMYSRRSQLNSWFTADPDKELETRRWYILWWAAVLIEYNPSLWKVLPPWAEIFTESLDVYRR